MNGRALGHLLKAHEFLAVLHNRTGPGLRSVRLVVAQDAAENAFRTILFSRGVARQGDHRPDQKALENKARLADIWHDLEPLIVDYGWLRTWRNRRRYEHVDGPPRSDPEITDEMLNRAVGCAENLVEVTDAVIT